MQESDAIIKVSYTVLESSGIIVILRQVPPPMGNTGSDHGKHYYNAYGGNRYNN